MSNNKKDIEINDAILNDYLEWIELNDVVCPFPSTWIKIIDTITRLTKIKSDDLINLIGRPCILNGWENPESIKKERFIRHLKFAHEKKIIYWIYFEVNEHQDYLISKYKNPEPWQHTGAFLQSEFPKNTKGTSKLERQKGINQPVMVYKSTNPFPIDD